jgi:hypothetical protein
MRLPVVLLVVSVGCGDQVDPALLGDRSFALSQNCNSDGTCEPTCQDMTCDVCHGGQPPSEGGCWVTGIGHLIDAGDRDNFGGNGMPMKAGYIRGEWENDDHATGDKLHGKVAYLSCRHVDEPGPGVPNGSNHTFNINQAYFGGPGRWFVPGTGWQDGYWFDVMAEDHGEPGNMDEYFFTVHKLVAPNQVGAMIFSTGGVLAGGNFQIHPPNDGHPFTMGTVPMWVMMQP